MKTETTEKQKQMMPGKVGHGTGTHSHLIEATFTVENEGTPFERRRVHHARPMCCGSRGQFQGTGNGLQWKAPLNTRTITCAKCREFRCVEEVE